MPGECDPQQARNVPARRTTTRFPQNRRRRVCQPPPLLGIRALRRVRFPLSRNHHHLIVACTPTPTYSTQPVHLICSPSIILLVLLTLPYPGPWYKPPRPPPPGSLRFSCAVPTLLHRSSSMPRTFLSTILFGGRRSTRRLDRSRPPRSAPLKTTSFFVASTRQPGAHSRNTRPDRVLQSRRRPGTIQCRRAPCLRAYASPLSNTRALLSFLHLLSLSGSSPLFVLDSLETSCARGTSYDCDVCICYVNIVERLTRIVWTTAAKKLSRTRPRSDRARLTGSGAFRLGLPL
ncbi:hypothetical protein L227DRAFT_159447 [Lentinus tigrinus ALCF2SS1-6]|uniref:Uncharacterized protein n=1 Tax=Lentinus tigrinus ALCF2SS1-6 TaxID=1328759 RepID=A0A5C2SDD8_9APHY|nr:hypothetical protein L227DRAFT_159447 [Lentinus tigrinus ALCF2SS1-6]